MTQRSTARSPYMEFAKLHSAAKYNLATSGVMGYPLSELPVRLEEMEINGQSFYGYAPLVERIARKNGVEPACVVYTIGTSMANLLAFGACTEAGDEVLTETPGYELIDSALRFLGVEVRQYQRRFDPVGAVCRLRGWPHQAGRSRAHGSHGGRIHLGRGTAALVKPQKTAVGRLYSSNCRAKVTPRRK